MRPAWATLRLFAQWLHPTTNTLKANPNRLVFLPVNALFAKHGAWSMLVKWTKMALRSVDEIADSIARDNSTRASSFVLEL